MPTTAFRYDTDLSELVAFPSVSALPDHLPDLLAAADWLAERLNEAGLRVGVGSRNSETAGQRQGQQYTKAGSSVRRGGGWAAGAVDNQGEERKQAGKRIRAESARVGAPPARCREGLEMGVVPVGCVPCGLPALLDGAGGCPAQSPWGPAAGGRAGRL